MTIEASAQQASGDAGADDRESGGDVPAPVIPPVVVGRPGPSIEPRAVDHVYRASPYRPDTAIDGWTDEHWAVRAVSLRGHAHRHGGVPRQDDMALARRSSGDGGLLVAVADGVSAAPQAHIGATTAVRYAVQWLDASTSAEDGALDATGLVRATAWALVEHAAAVLDIATDAAEAEPQVATTLVAATIDPPAGGEAGGVVRLAAVGDSGAWVLSGGRFDRVVGGKARSDDAISSSAVTALPRVPNEIATATVELGPDDVLIIATDGIGDPLGAGSGSVGALLRSLLEGRVPTLVELAHAVDFSRETFDDDRTLVAVRPRGVVADRR
ncbi:MAG: protein phosphatase 2C domain-containing protein [Actinomycetota bacterium]|nr:protein phosphatase 2C domain-containing protein [Actinomycetota bacterium]